jgi:hypothetical protein
MRVRLSGLLCGRDTADRVEDTSVTVASPYGPPSGGTLKLSDNYQNRLFSAGRIPADRECLICKFFATTSAANPAGDISAPPDSPMLIAVSRRDLLNINQVF